MEEKANDMKPTKNKIYCPSIRRTKMLFKEERKALNFIKFNRDTILEETGYAPSRAYYCPFCLGWHVTSNEDTVLGKSLDAKDERIVGQAARHGAERLESGVTKAEFRKRLFQAVAWAVLGDTDRYREGIAFCQDQIGMIRVKSPSSGILGTLSGLLSYGEQVVLETNRQAERPAKELSLEKEDMSLRKLDRAGRRNALIVMELRELLSQERSPENLDRCLRLASSWQGRHQDAICQGLRSALKALFPAVLEEG